MTTQQTEKELKTERMIKLIDELSVEDLNQDFYPGIPLLSYMIYLERLDVAEKMLNDGANTEVVDSGDCTPLFYAAHHSAEAVKLLLAFGANVNYVNVGGNTPLHFAITVEIAQLLIDAGADINARNDDGNTAAEEWIF